jgi:hypothetical protein
MVFSQVDLEEKVCSRCEQSKPKAEFHAHSAAPGGKHSWCKQCRSDYAAQKLSILKSAVYSHYGYLCACCRETEPLFLSIDHIHNDGATHRKSLKGNKVLSLYQSIIAENFPDTFQVLCMNCNRGKWMNGGVCPHSYH